MHRRTALCRSLLRSFRQVPEHVRAETAALQAPTTSPPEAGRRTAAAAAAECDRQGSKALLAMNQPGGFKCPSCAFPDADERRKLEFCENGAKALAWEATEFRSGRELFARHTVTELMAQTDYWLGPADRADALRRSHRPLCAVQLGRCLRTDRSPPAGAGQSSPGRVLHLRAHAQRSGVPVFDLRARVRHQ